MNLLIEIGNTQLKWAVSKGEKIVASFSQPLVENLCFSVLNQYVSNMDNIFVANVAGEQVAEKLQDWAIGNHLSSLNFIYTEKKHKDLINGYSDPSQLGVDRWLGLIGAWGRTATDFIVIDAGTAITVDYVLQGGQHQGGYIFPGFDLMKESLVQQTEACVLGTVDWLGMTMERGKDTSQGMVGGIMSLVVTFINSINTDGSQSEIFLTGGNASIIQKYCSQDCHVVPNLVFEGMTAYSMSNG